MKKVVFLVFGTLLLFVILGLGILIFLRNDKIVAGYVTDCQTQEPISGATVEVNQRGWGFEKYLIWDKSYIYKTTTNTSGYFKITYNVGKSAHIVAHKPGYLKAWQFENPSEDISIGITKGNKENESTQRCRLSSECIITTTENNVSIIRNICE